MNKQSNQPQNFMDLDEIHNFVSSDQFKFLKTLVQNDGDIIMKPGDQAIVQQNNKELAISLFCLEEISSKAKNEKFNIVVYSAIDKKNHSEDIKKHSFYPYDPDTAQILHNVHDEVYVAALKETRSENGKPAYEITSERALETISPDKIANNLSAIIAIREKYFSKENTASIPDGRITLLENFSLNATSIKQLI